MRLTIYSSMKAFAEKREQENKEKEKQKRAKIIEHLSDDLSKVRQLIKNNEEKLEKLN
ncbi:signal transduction histidine kinase [Evansella vedderi]|uniref:Signal transduction histidine kinase n=2 Tax=Evansella vedderi TaxID=38282 RepID=A0ABT9ZWT2_9BACI|nr:signal transduction histidine kinase [Evansella vedderi]